MIRTYSLLFHTLVPSLFCRSFAEFDFCKIPHLTCMPQCCTHCFWVTDRWGNLSSKTELERRGRWEKQTLHPYACIEDVVLMFNKKTDSNTYLLSNVQRKARGKQRVWREVLEHEDTPGWCDHGNTVVSGDLTLPTNNHLKSCTCHLQVNMLVGNSLFWDGKQRHTEVLMTCWNKRPKIRTQCPEWRVLGPVCL